jgi:hypothetical protein
MHNIGQTQKLFFNTCFSDMAVPVEIETLRQNLTESITGLDNITLIFGKDLFVSLSRDVRYYYNRGLISKNEVLSLQEDLLKALKQLEKMMQNGRDDANIRKECYLSLLDIESNCGHALYDGKHYMQYWVYSLNFISITDPVICMSFQKRFEAMKKQAVLLSQSNEIVRAEFLERQQHHIESITNDIL